MKTAALALLALATSCGAFSGIKSKESNVCPEYRDQVCLAGQSCQMDEKRGCKVCQCNAAVREGPDGKPALPPTGQQ